MQSSFVLTVVTVPQGTCRFKHGQQNAAHRVTVTVLVRVLFAFFVKLSLSLHLNECNDSICSRH